MVDAPYEPAYTAGARPPWDLDGPTPFVAELADDGRMRGAVLDAGCGTGENALFLAVRGHEVVGADAAPTAIARARAKAVARGIAAVFVHADVTALPGPADRFDTALDSGLFHCLDATAQARYAAELHRVCRAGARLHLLCLSEANDLGPRRSGFGTHGVDETELRAAFDGTWNLDELSPRTTIVHVPGHGEQARHYWLVRLIRV